MDRTIGGTDCFYTGVAWLELQRPAPFLVGPSFSVGDVTAAVTLTYIIKEKVAPALAAWSFAGIGNAPTVCEAMPAFEAAPYSAMEAAQSGWRPEGP